MTLSSSPTLPFSVAVSLDVFEEAAKGDDACVCCSLLVRMASAFSNGLDDDDEAPPLVTIVIIGDNKSVIL